MSFSLPYHTVARLQDGTTIAVNLSLPHPEDMPQMEGVRLPSGNYKIKEITDKNKKANYSQLIRSLAPYVASHYFNVSPMINTVNVEGNVTVGDENSESITLYNISFDRAKFDTLNLSEMELEDVLSYFSVTNNMKKETQAKLFVVKKKEEKQKVQVTPAQTIDPLLADVARFIVQEQNGSAATIQRKFKIGFNQAGRIMEQLEGMGIVGPAKGSNPRDVLIGEEELTRMISPSRQ